MGLNVCGVDLLCSNHGLVVMEVNSSPGLKGIETATNKDITSLIIQFVEKKHKLLESKSDRSKTRGKG